MVKASITDEQRLAQCCRNSVKSTSVIGGAAVVTLAAALVRTKLVAVLVGPSGVGLLALYVAIIGVMSTVSGFGLTASGVRAISTAHGNHDYERLAKTIKSLRRLVFICGTVGLLAMSVTSDFLSRVTFGSSHYATSISLLGLALFFGSAATGGLCLLQGTRQLRTLTQVTIANAVTGTVITGLCVLVMGAQGLCAALILTAAAAFLATWYSTRSVPLIRIQVSWGETWVEAKELLRFGTPFMLSTLVSTISGYYVGRVLVAQFGLQGAGVWHAAFALSGALVTFVLGAMANDYYPRLTAVADDDRRVNEEVNAQTEVNLFLATPALAATLATAPLVIRLFYTDEFASAAAVLQWLVFGIFGRLISWPLGYVLLAKGRSSLFLATEILHNLFYIVAIKSCTAVWGLPGAGVAFVLLYLLVTPVNYFTARAISGTHWTNSIKAHSFALGTALGLVATASVAVQAQVLRYVMLSSMLLLITAYCFSRLARRIGWKVSIAESTAVVRTT